MRQITFHNYIRTAGLAAMCWMAASCKKLIETPGNPATAITEAQQFADSTTAMTAISGIYTYGAYNTGFTYSDGALASFTGLSSDELIYTSSGDVDGLAFYNYGLLPLNGNVGYLWTSPYQGLYPVNVTLEKIAESSTLSASFKTQVTAELKVVRALYYFNLVNLFGAVPLTTSSDYKKTANLPRMSVDSVYTQIFTDLNEAQEALPVAYPSAGRARPNQYTALAFLAKAHLYRKEWQPAYDAANTVISSGTYTLEPDLNNVFLDGSTEAIWQLPVLGNNSATAEANNFVPYDAGIVPSYILSPNQLNAFETGDQRGVKWVGDAVINVAGVDKDYYYPYKYKNRLPAATTEGYIVFRLADLYLIRAEAAVHLGNTGVALSDINTVRARAGLSDTPASTDDEIMTAVLHERQAELFTEWGNRWYDLKRTGTADAVLGAEKNGWKANADLYPVPYQQLQFDPFLTQNPGY
jgi:hypothetical protein